MAVFKDQHGREWSVTIDAWQLRVVRERTGFEVGKLLEDNMRRWEELADPVLLGSVLFALCQEQAKGAGVTEEQFHRGLAGDAMQAAYDAFERAYLDFSPSRRRTLLEAAAAKGRELQERAEAKALKGLGAIDVAGLLSATSNPSAGGSPESPASIPAG